MKVITSEKVPIKSWAENLDELTLKQAINLANHPFAYKWICLMSDSHPGFGMPIGGVMATKDVIIPNSVGVDIGCGVEAVKTSVKNIDTETLKKILGEIRETIPVGFKHNQTPQKWDGFDKAPDIWIIQKELASARYQIGTLGGGNHFIELLKDTEGFIWIMLHSGSRNFGFKTAHYYHDKAVKASEKFSKSLPSKDLSFLLIDSKEGQEYFKAMNYCLEFAQANRDLMMEKAKEIFRKYTKAGFENPINIHHNYASLEEYEGQKVFVHRKGATKATQGLIGIIPGSMGAPSYIVEGLGNKESFNSCSHGAGRKMGRREAIRNLDIQAEQRKMQGILGAPRTRNELQEAPGAYKDIAKVMNLQKDLVRIKLKLFPIAVITGN